MTTSGMTMEQQFATAIVANTTRETVTVIELGAHHGNDTVLLYDAAVRPWATYIAVEADPRNIPVLQQRIGERDIQVLHAAIWDEPGMITLHQSEGNHNGSSSVREPHLHLQYFPDIEFKSDIQVPALTLDAIATAYNVGLIDLIWCDIQGAERNMVAGGRKTLERTRWLLTECDRVEMYRGQATRNELIKILGLHWELVAEWPETANLLLRNASVALAE